MENFKELVKEIEALEKEIIFDYFNSDLAFKIGVALINEAKERNNKIALDISLCGRVLFHYTSDGNQVSNDIMIEKKKNTTNYNGHPSIWTHYKLHDLGMTMYDKWGLSPEKYADVGGCFPIRLKNCSGVVGTITVSGFDHHIDHQIIIDVLRKTELFKG